MKNNYIKLPIPYSRQKVSAKDIKSVVKVLESDYLTQGDVTPLFEKKVAEYVKAKHAVATNSATSALHIACMALNLGHNDWLWTSPNTFVASANCGIYCGAKIDFVDIDILTGNMDVRKLEEKLEQSKKRNCLPKIIIPVHFAGQSCDMKSIHKLSQIYNFKIIEDASHGIGGLSHKKNIGCCFYSDITVFSFHPVKIITTGEGGMAITNSLVLYDKLRQHSSHGIISDKDKMETRSSDQIWNYQQISMGFNYRMTDIAAALGISQLENIDEFILKRRKLAQYYDANLLDLKVNTPFEEIYNYSTYHLYVIRLKLLEISKSQKQIYEELRKLDIQVNLHYIPVHLQPFYKNLGFNEGQFPIAEKFFKEILSIPLFVDLTETEQSYIIDKLNKTIC